MHEQSERLLEVARNAAARAYCPHSHFHVGAAVQAGGRIFTGSNIENASYGLTVCADHRPSSKPCWLVTSASRPSRWPAPTLRPTREPSCECRAGRAGR